MNTAVNGRAGTEVATVNRGEMSVGNRGITIQSYPELMEFAETVAQSGLAPKGVDKPASIAIAIQMGLEVGLPPLAALQNIAVINGRPSMWGDAQLAVCRSSGVFDDAAFEEGWEKTDPKNEETILAYCVVRRKPDGKPVRREFSIADAKRAGLWDKAGPWKQYPKRMLQCRARSWALRDAFPDLLRGMLAREEAQDIVDVPIESVTPTPEPMPTPKRSRPAKTGEAPPQPTPTPAPAEAIAEPMPANDHGLTDKQLKAFNVHVGAHDGITESQLAQMIKDSTEGGQVNLDVLDGLIEKAGE